MSTDTQARRRKDKRKKKGRAEAQSAEQWRDDVQLETHDDDQFYVEPDSVSDEGTGDEELKEHHSEAGGSGCLTVLVFLVLLAGVGVLLGLIYVQSQGIAHVDTPAPPPTAAPRVETIVETITEGEAPPPPAADQGGSPAAGQPEDGAPVEVVEQVIEEHIVYVDAPPDQQEQVVYVEAPQPQGIQLEGSEPQLEQQYAAAPAPPPQLAEEVVTEEKLVRMRQVVKQMTDAEGNVREEIVSEEVLEDGAEEPVTDQASESEPEQQQPESEQTQQEEAAAEVDEGVDVTEPAEDSPQQEEAVVEVEEAEVEVKYDGVPPPEDDEEEVSEAEVEVEDEPLSEEEEQLQQEVVEEVVIPAEPASGSVPSSVPVDTNKYDTPVVTPATEKPKEAVKAEKPTEAVKAEKPTEAVKAEEPKEAVKEQKAKEPVKEEKAKEPVKAEKPKEAVKEEKPVEKPVQTEQQKQTSEPKPTEAPPVKKETPSEKPKVATPTEKPVVKEVPTEKRAPKTFAKESEEIERIRSAQRESEKKADAPSKPAVDTPAAKQKADAPSKPAVDTPAAKQTEPAAKAPSARADSPVERGTDKHAKQTGQAAPVAADEGIVADEEEEQDQADEYEKAEVTGPEDWDIRDELDDADNLVDTDPVAALNAFGAILSRRPRSPRALWGRARALNSQAAVERSNNMLDKAIKAFRDVLDLDLDPETPVPLELYRQAAETCVQQMRFKGEMDQAARIQQRLIQKFPDDYQLRNHLATVFMTYGQNTLAEEVLQEVLRLWPDNGYAKSHLGFIRRVQGKHKEATELMQAGLDSDEPGVHDKRFYNGLGDSYDRTGRRDLALKIYEEGVSRGLLLSVLQRSQYNVDRLTGRPFWTPEQTGSQELIRELEANYQTIRGEMLALLDSEHPEDGFQPEQEQLRKSGDWKQFTMFRRGRKSQYACVKTPRTCEIVDKFPEAAGCRRGQVKFSMLAPGTTVWPHTGPTNCRLRLHLGLQVPSGTGIRVAGEKRTWEEGKVLIIDDSFEHDVWNEGDAARFVMIVDIWHPELTEEERRTLPSV